MEKGNIVQIDCCLPDYFQGSGSPIMAVPVWRGMSRPELRSSIIEAYNADYEHLTYNNAWPELSDVELHQACMELIQAQYPFRNTSVPPVNTSEVYLYLAWEN